jgi:hypothetical protein
MSRIDFGRNGPRTWCGAPLWLLAKPILSPGTDRGQVAGEWRGAFGQHSLTKQGVEKRALAVVAVPKHHDLHSHAERIAQPRLHYINSAARV